MTPTSAKEATVGLRTQPFAAVTGTEAETAAKPLPFPIHVISEAERQRAAEQQFHLFLLEQATTTATVAGRAMPVGTAAATAE